MKLPKGEFGAICLTCLGSWDHKATDRLIEMVTKDRATTDRLIEKTRKKS